MGTFSLSVPDSVKCARTLKGGVSGCDDSSQSPTPWTGPPGFLLPIHALQEQRPCHLPS